MDSSSRASTTATPRPTASPTRPSRWSCSRRAIARGPGVALGLGRLEQGVGAAVQRPRPLLGGAQRRAAPPSRPRGRRGTRRRAARAAWCRAPRRGRPRRWPAATRARRAPARSRSRASVAASDGLVEALGLGAGVAGLRAVLAELLGHRGQGRVGLVQLGQGDVDPPPGLLALALQRRGVEGEPLEGVRGAWSAARPPRRRPPAPRSGSAGSTSRRRRSAAPSRSPSRVTAVRSGASATSDRAAARSSTTATLNSSRASAGRSSAGALHHVHGVRRAGRAGPARRCRRCRAPPSRIPARPRSSSLRCAIAPRAASTSSDGDRVGGTRRGPRRRRPRSRCGRCSSAATEPSSPLTESVAASSAPAPSLRFRPSSSASLRALSELRSRSAAVSSSRVLASRSSMSESSELAASCSESRPSSPASSPATRDSSEVKSCWARSARATASARASVSRPTSSSAAAARLRSPLTWPCRRASPSRRSAAARCSPATRRSSSAKRLLGGLARARRRRRGRCGWRLDLGGDLVLLRAHPRGLGLELVGVAALGHLGLRGGVAHPLGGQAGGAAQPLAQAGQPEPGLLRLGQRRQVLAQRGLEGGLGLAGGGQRRLDLGAALAAGPSRRPAPARGRCGRWRGRRPSAGRGRRGRRPGRSGALRATSACRPSGLSWRRISLSRSASRVRLPSVESSLRSAFSLRLRCLRTPAASSMKPRRSSGVACRIESSWPCPTITCISRPMPESLSSSCTSSRRQWLPLMAYSDPPLRNIVRLIVTSAYSIGSAPSVLSMVSWTSARPSGGRPDVPAKMTSSILPPRSDLAPCSPITHASASTTLDLPDPLGPDDAGDAGFELQRRGGGEGLEALEREALEVQRLLSLRRRRLRS